MEVRLDPRDEKRLPIVTRWLDLTTWLMETTAGMPRKWRPSLVGRIEREAVEILGVLTDAAYQRRKARLLTQANLGVNRLRILLELACRLQALSAGGYEHVTLALDEIGRMLGGWMKEAAGRERTSAECGVRSAE
jgi:hypothetical protein